MVQDVHMSLDTDVLQLRYGDHVKCDIDAPPYPEG